MLLIYTDSRAETTTTVTGTAAFKYGCISLYPQLHTIISLPKATTTPLIYHTAVHRTHFSPKKLQLETV